MVKANPTISIRVLQGSVENHFSYKSRKFGNLTTNIYVCINTAMKATRNLPITALVKSTYIRLGELFVRKAQRLKHSFKWVLNLHRH
ncbi:hypothetical protein Ahy_B02g058618 [Arachis hypogaea]|uniref:Uncharacterized protein n=1 Tax=Arachis hypogaea TaxID=3818 RepID=A0A445AF04_ARAHY|nr:hypothetical protein Ahy_B02g058618 [Arachis hypogaea]